MRTPYTCLLFVYRSYLCMEHGSISELPNKSKFFVVFFFLKNSQYLHNSYSNFFCLLWDINQWINSLSSLVCSATALQLFMTNLSGRIREKYWHELFTEERRLMNNCFSTQITSTWYFIMAKVKFNWNYIEKGYSFRIKRIDF